MMMVVVTLCARHSTQKGNISSLHFYYLLSAYLNLNQISAFEYLIMLTTNTNKYGLQNKSDSRFFLLNDTLYEEVHENIKTGGF